MSVLRVKFTKHGALKYIGHLDVMRYFQKCIRRAQIDVAYTGGFSPHQVMTFAQPLGVGLESNAEYMDIEVVSFESCEAVRDALNAASVPEIRIVNVTLLPENAGNAMASVFAADYAVRFREGRELPLFRARNPKESGAPEPESISGKRSAEPSDAEENRTRRIADALADFLAQDEIPYEKETKKGTRTLNLRDGIYRMDWDADARALRMCLSASSAGNIKPSQVLEALSVYLYGEKLLQENALLITREELYTNLAGEGEEMRLVPMDKIGENRIRRNAGKADETEAGGSKLFDR